MIWAKAGAAAMLLAVAAGAFGAHGLRGRADAAMLEIWRTAALWHALHGLGLFAVAWLSTQSPAASRAGWLFLAGILLFSGSLYAMALTGVKALGAITPLGGLCFLAGWALLFLAAGS